MKATCEQEIFKLFVGHKMQRMLFLQVREKYQEENLKTEYFLSCGKNGAFSCRL